MTARVLAPVDLADPGLYDRGIPHDVFAALRATPGLVWNAIDGDPDDGFWAVTRHADVVEVSRDTTTYSSAVGHIQIYDIDDDALEARASMIDMDPPVHTRLRRLVSAAFTPRHVQDYRPAIRERVRAALDALRPRVAATGWSWGPRTTPGTSSSTASRARVSPCTSSPGPTPSPWPRGSRR